MSYGTSIRLALPFDEAVARVKTALADEGFGVLSEIDVRATMKKKLDADMEDYVILGACNPPLAHRALDADRSVGLLLPCNVVVRAAGEGSSIVETLDPLVITKLAAGPGLDEVAEDAAVRLRSVRAALSPSTC